MNNLSVEKANWLIKVGCKFVPEELYTGKQSNKTLIITQRNEIVGYADDNNDFIINCIFIYRLEELQSVDAMPGHQVCIGYDKYNSTWIAIVQNNVYKFPLKYQVKKNSILDKRPHKYPYVAYLYNDCKRLAIDFAKSFYAV